MNNKSGVGGTLTISPGGAGVNMKNMLASIPSPMKAQKAGVGPPGPAGAAGADGPEGPAGSGGGNIERIYSNKLPSTTNLNEGTETIFITPDFTLTETTEIWVSCYLYCIPNPSTNDGYVYVCIQYETDEDPDPYPGFITYAWMWPVVSANTDSNMYIPSASPMGYMSLPPGIYRVRWDVSALSGDVQLKQMVVFLDKVIPDYSS